MQDGYSCAWGYICCHLWYQIFFYIGFNSWTGVYFKDVSIISHFTESWKIQIFRFLWSSPLIYSIYMYLRPKWAHIYYFPALLDLQYFLSAFLVNDLTTCKFILSIMITDCVGFTSDTSIFHFTWSRKIYIFNFLE